MLLRTMTKSADENDARYGAKIPFMPPRLVANVLLLRLRDLCTPISGC